MIWIVCLISLGHLGCSRVVLHRVTLTCPSVPGQSVYVFQARETIEFVLLQSESMLLLSKYVESDSSIKFIELHIICKQTNRSLALMCRKSSKCSCEER